MVARSQNIPRRLFPAGGSRGLASQVIEHPGYAWHRSNLAHLNNFSKTCNFNIGSEMEIIYKPFLTQGQQRDACQGWQELPS